MSPEHVPPSHEDRLVEELLDELAHGVGLASGPPGDLRREYLELLGLVPAALEPLKPSPGLRDELLAAAGRRPAPVTALPGRPPRPPAQRRWLLPLAAALIAALALFSGWQVLALERQQERLDRMARRLEELDSRRPLLEDLRSNLALVTSPGVEVCALRPVGATPQQPGSRGVLFVAADHQHWYLAVDGLEPCREGRSYQLWWELDTGEAVSAGTFDVSSGIRVELSSDEMPAGTRAVIITLEPAGGSERPSGPRVLRGDEVMRIL